MCSFTEPAIEYRRGEMPLCSFPRINATFSEVLSCFLLSQTTLSSLPDTPKTHLKLCLFNLSESWSKEMNSIGTKKEAPRAAAIALSLKGSQQFPANTTPSQPYQSANIAGVL
eukprot:gb/GEZN01022682.1/.p1 GENE.gb/GEZN01022682.1/~~gb/GEZN01022682.1/.p1  ORF type:complete len:113 (-),score=6.20 gb/GEZN01022682.1/:176-514(-)